MAFSSSYQQKMSVETFDFVCTTCAEDNKTLEAVKYCVECSRYCCQSCTDAHKFPALRSHALLDVNQGQQSSGQPSSLPEFPTERCRKHKGKVIDMYCEGHNVVGCSTCFVKDHKSCEDDHIHSIPDMIDTLFKLSDSKQTQSLLKDMMVSMETVSKSNDITLQSLNKAKKEVLDNVTTFQKALEAIVRKAAETSRQQVEAAYKKLESELINDKRTVDGVRGDLKATDEKLNVAEGNRAQRFVCTKLGQEMLKEADDVRMKQEVHPSTIIQISFNPDQSLMNYMKALDGIGQVKMHGKEKRDLYKMKGIRNINIKLSDDSEQCRAKGCCMTRDHQLLVTDRNNKKLKRIDIHNMSVVDYCTLDSSPDGVCCISKHEVAVACRNEDKIQFVSIQGKMTPTRQIKMSHFCYGIAFNDDKLYVTDTDKKLYVYDMTGTRLKTITQDNSGNKLFDVIRHITFNKCGSRMFVGDGVKGLVCFDGVGNYLSTINETECSFADGVCVDERENVFVVGWRSYNVVQFSENGEKVGVVVKKGDGLQTNPYSVCFHQGLNRVFVTMNGSDVVKMYELE